MKKTTTLFLILMSLLIGMTSCNSDYQYDVYVRNETGQTIRVDFKSKVDIKGIVEESITLEDKEHRRIINSKNIEVAENTGWTSAEHSKYLAEYVNAYTENKQPSKIKWNDEKIKFNVVDIGQGEFEIVYTKDDF